MLLAIAPALAEATPATTMQGAPGPAAPQTADQRAPERGAELTVYLITMGAGGVVYERFGHNAIGIFDGSTGSQVAYNYGLFDFEQKNFILRFIQGKMDYWMEGYNDAERMVNFYIGQDRSVWVQELNLTPAQRADLRDFLEWNALPENRFYRYDYFRDNCSTRVRDAIDRVIGGQLRAQTDSIGSGMTFRDHAGNATGDSPLLYTGIMLGLGSPTDREISVWEDMFLPLRLRDHMRNATIRGPTGEQIPLVKLEQPLHESRLFTEVPPALPSVWMYLGLGLLLGAGIVVSARAASSRFGRAAFAFLVASWGVVAGFFGLVILLLWLFTAHDATYGNENLFFFNPLLLVAGALLPFAPGVRSRFRRPALVVTGAIATLSLLGLLFKILPWSHQENFVLIALALPVNLALAIAAVEFSRRDDLTSTRLASLTRDRVPQGRV